MKTFLCKIPNWFTFERIFCMKSMNNFKTAVGIQQQQPNSKNNIYHRLSKNTEKYHIGTYC